MKNNNGIDLIKFIMAIIIVGAHTHALEHCTVPLLIEINRILVDCSVPYFFLASGFLLAGKMASTDAPEVHLSILKRQTLKLIRFYLIWSLVYFPLALHSYIGSGRSFLSCAVSYTKWFFLVGEHYNSWMLWYLLSSIYALLFVQILYKCHLKISTITFLGFILLLISFGFDWVASTDAVLSAPLTELRILLEKTILNGRLLRGAFYLPAGMLLKDKIHSILPGIAILIPGAIGFYLFNNTLAAISTAICSIGIFCISAYLPLKDSGFYRILRSMSSTVYFIHLYIWTIYYMCVYHQKTYGLDSFLFTAILSCAIAFGVYKFRTAKAKD